jgi:pyruvate dehydrogenase E2 component (dihydrolipoamide acetyltransferase)
VAVIKDVPNKTVTAISKELKTFVSAIRSGAFDASILLGGTFTISNLGMYDIDIGTPIINTPEAGILCLGATRKEYVIQEDDTAVVRPMMTMSLTLDHAAMDGLDGAKFMVALKEIITFPDKQLFG